MHSDRESAARIVSEIRAADRRVRAKVSFLKYQDQIGLFLFVLATCGFFFTAWGALQGLSYWIVIPLIAFFTSILHEIEHDLIHDLYYRGNRWIQNLMFAFIWILRPNTISPWKRKSIHLLHHKVSGSPPDIEERLITNGMPYGFKRILCMMDGFLNMILRRREVERIPGMRTFNIRLASLPMVPIFYGSILVECVLIATGNISPLRTTLDFLMVVWVIPNVIRQACLVFLSSTMHYYGGVDSVFRQTQVLNAWYFLPMQLFCFNFGSTHGIHHFVVNQPFYLREMVKRSAHAAFRENGIHFNDLSTFRSANHYEPIGGI